MKEKSNNQQGITLAAFSLTILKNQAHERGLEEMSPYKSSLHKNTILI